MLLALLIDIGYIIITLVDIIIIFDYFDIYLLYYFSFDYIHILFQLPCISDILSFQSIFIGRHFGLLFSHFIAFRHQPLWLFTI